MDSPDHELASGVVVDLRQTLDRLGDDVELLGELVALFFEEAPILLDRIVSRLDAGDFPAVQHAAHTLRGMASNFSAAEAVAASQLLESAAARRDCAMVRTAWPMLQSSISRLDGALRDLPLHLDAARVARPR